MRNTIKLTIILSLSLILIIGCGTSRKTGFALQSEIWEADRDTNLKEIYLTGTKSIDTADVDIMIHDIFRIEIDQYPELLKVYSRVYDSLGNFITNLADPYKTTDRKYFTAVDETVGKVYFKRDEPIPEFNVREYGALDSIAYNIVLSIDYSGSMDAVMGAIHEGTEIFTKLKMPYDQIAITTFNKDIDVKVPLSKDTSEILTLFRAKKHQGFGLFSGVMDAMYNSMDQFEGTNDTVPRVLVTFSDGDDNYSKEKIEDIIRRAKEEKIIIFPVAFGYSKDDELKLIAEQTGGRFYKAYTKEELIAIFRDIYMSLRYYYYITYKPPKFWGYHEVFATLELPGRSDSLVAVGNYDTSDLWDGLGSAFERPILFEFDKSDLLPQSDTIIVEIVDAMMSRPQLRLEIQGHTDNSGSIEYNQKLSERRAQAVLDAIVSKGINARRLRSRGFGMSKPVATNETEEGRARNRRTEFIILAK